METTQQGLKANRSRNFFKKRIKHRLTKNISEILDADTTKSNLDTLTVNFISPQS